MLPAVTPFQLFDPTTLPDASQFTGAHGAETLLEAARHFPGGPVMLVFALFWSPVGPGIPAGVLLARHIPLHPAVTFALYAASDLMGALVCHPLYVLLRRHGGRVPALRWIGTRMLRLAMFGTPAPRPAELDGTGGAGPALWRIGTIGFGVDVYSAGMVMTGLRVPRLLGWGAAIAGDLVWFALLLGTSIVAAAAIDDDRVVGGVVLLAMLIIPPLARRLIPALRPAPVAGRAARDAPPSGADVPTRSRVA